PDEPGLPVHGPERTRGAVLEDDPGPVDPVHLFDVGEVADHLGGRPRARALVAAEPALGQSGEQGAKGLRRATKYLVAGLQREIQPVVHARGEVYRPRPGAPTATVPVRGGSNAAMSPSACTWSSCSGPGRPARRCRPRSWNPMPAGTDPFIAATASEVTRIWP